MEDYYTNYNNKGNNSGGGTGGGGGGRVVAPFVVKMYRMVNDPATDSLITWGRDNNSFVVVNPFGFSERLLPAHFKHNNFSSFIRQLNTYTQLLSKIVRRSSNNDTKKCSLSLSLSLNNRNIISSEKKEGEEEERVVLEVVKLRQEQRGLQEEVQRMWRWMHETERRPREMFDLLLKMVENPHLLQRVANDGGGRERRPGGDEKRDPHHKSKEEEGGVEPPGDPAILVPQYGGVLEMDVEGAYPPHFSYSVDGVLI